MSLAILGPEVGLTVDGRRELANRVRTQQLDMSLRLAIFTWVIAFSVVQVILVIFWPSRSHIYLSGLEAAVVGLSLLGGAACWRWIRGPKPADSRRFFRLVQLIAFGYGLALGSIPVQLFIYAAPAERTVIAATCAGLIATGVSFAVTPQIAFVFSGPIVIGSFAALAMTGEIFNIYLAVLLTLYAAFLSFLVLRFSRLVAAREIAQSALGRQQELTSLLLRDFQEGASDWLWETDCDLRLQHASSRFEKVAGLPSEKLHGMPFDELFRSETDAESGTGELIATLRGRRPFRDLLSKVRVNDDERWWSISGKPINDLNGEFAGYRGVGADVTEKKRAEDRLSFLALNDSLTGLPNRLCVLKRLEAAKARFGPDADFSLFCLDIDGFKGVNDAFGHAVGDELLQGVARRLADLCRSVPSATVARMSGDEFVILFEGAHTSQQVVLSRCAVAILNAMREPLLVGDLKLTVGVSIGIAIASESGAHDILRRADVALYRVKESGRGHYCFFEPQMDQAREARRGLMIDLGLALAQDQFTLNFQPLVGAHSFKVEGFEALLRWSHPSRGMVSPAEFIPLAEESGAIFGVGEWVLRHACLAAITWPRHVRVAVNVSPIQLRHSDFADIVASALQSTGLAADRLELEVTESVFLDYNWITEQNLQRLRALGVRLSLDDFGTGYSSLNYLRKIAFDKVKIDQAFVRGLPAATDLVIVKAVVEIALSRGMTVVAEGVETAEQRDCLRAQGCAQFQGYLFSAPLSEEDAALFLESNTRSTSAAKAA